MDASFLKDLNPEQYEAAACTGHCLTIAAPGSGKTKMLAAKAAYLLSGGKTVVAVTFTKDSALELRDRIIKQAGEDSRPRLLVGTFHGIDLYMANPTRKSEIGQQILKYSKSTIAKPWKIARDSFRYSTVLRAIDNSGIGDVDMTKAMSIIESVKSGHQKPENEKIEKLVRTYTEIMERHEVIDHQDILLKTNECILSGEITPLKTDFLLLDEFQDTDIIQYKWAILHAKSGSVLTCVGDDDQSIYAFRRALGFEGMKMFADELMAKKVVLGLNYRSHTEVLTPSASLISRNLDRMEKSLISFKGIGGSVAWEKFNSKFIEAKGCIKEIVLAIEKNQTIGILARQNKGLECVESELIAKEIPYSCSKGESILSFSEASVFLAGLSCVVRSDIRDTDELLGWCGVDEIDIKTIHNTLNKYPLRWFYDDGKNVFNNLPLKDSTKSTVRSISRRMSEWRCFVESKAYSFVVERVKELLAEYSIDKRSPDRFDVLSKIFDSVGKKKEGNISLVEKIESIRKLIDSHSSEKNEIKQVSLMTAHASKGLEFDMVWIVGAQEGLFPDDKSMIQEERRLMYVAMTRARKNLWISGNGKKDISRFVIESGAKRVPIDYFVGL